MATLFLNRGKMDNFDEKKIKKAITRLARVSDDKIGQIRIQKAYSFVDVDQNVMYECIRSLNNKKISGRKVKVEQARN